MLVCAGTLNELTGLKRSSLVATIQSDVAWEKGDCPAHTARLTQRHKFPRVGSMSACICEVSGQSCFRRLSFHGTRPYRFSLRCSPEVLSHPSSFSLTCTLQLLALAIIVQVSDQIASVFITRTHSHVVHGL